MKISKLNIEGYIGELDSKSAFAGEKNFTLLNLKKFLAALKPDVTDIHVNINSGGGSVYEGWDIHNELKNSGKRITSIGQGMVGSIATIIYMSADKANRKIIKGTKFFIHYPYWQPDESVPMEAEDLLNLGEDLQSEQDKILNFYADNTKSDISKIKPLMAKATDLTSEQAVALGFASEEIEEPELVNYHEYKLVAMVNIKPKQKTQDNMIENKGILAMLKRLNKKFSNFGKDKFFDMEISATDDAGNAVTLFIETDTEDLTGKAAYLIDADGNQSPAPDGKYTDANGKAIMVSGNMVESVKEAEPKPEDNKPDPVALQASLDEAQAKVTELTTQLEASKAEGVTIKAQFETINKEFQALSKTLIGDKADFKPGQQTFNNGKKPVGVSEKNAPYLNELASQFKK